MATEPTTSSDERIVAIERAMAAQTAELERLRLRDPAAAMQRALQAPRAVSPAALEREQHDRAAAQARQAAVERAVEQAALERRVHQPELAEHEHRLAGLDAEIEQATLAAAEAQFRVDTLCARRRYKAAHPPWAAPSPFDVLKKEPLRLGEFEGPAEHVARARAYKGLFSKGGPS
jgi:hypothetical protein